MQWISGGAHFEEARLREVVTTSRRHSYWLLLAGVCVLFPVDVLPSRAATPRSGDEVSADDFLTTENSSDLDRDYKGIDSFRCSVWVNWRGGTGSVEGELHPEEAESAHELLKTLLAQFPLRQDCYFGSHHFNMASDQGIAFRSPHRGRGSVFVLRLYPGNYMELEYYPTNEAKDTSIGATFDLNSEIESRYYSVLADCLKKDHPSIAAEFWWKSTRTWISVVLGYVLALILSGGTVLLAVVLTWRLLRRNKETLLQPSPEKVRDADATGS